MPLKLCTINSILGGQCRHISVSPSPQKSLSTSMAAALPLPFIAPMDAQLLNCSGRFISPEPAILGIKMDGNVDNQSDRQNWHCCTGCLIKLLQLEKIFLMQSRGISIYCNVISGCLLLHIYATANRGKKYRLGVLSASNIVVIGICQRRWKLISGCIRMNLIQISCRLPS